MQWDWVEIVKAIAWPFSMIVAVFALRPGLLRLFAQFPAMLRKVGLPGGFSFELTPVQGVSGGSADLLTFAGNIAPVAPHSGESQLQRLIAHVSPGDYLVIQLGKGEKWITSRLFLFAVILKQTKNLRFVVFTEDAGDVRNRYLGSVTVENLRWELGRRYPWLEAAYAQVLSDWQDQQNGSPLQLTDSDVNKLIDDFLDRIRTWISIKPADILSVCNILLKLQEKNEQTTFMLSKSDFLRNAINSDKAISSGEQESVYSHNLEYFLSQLITEENLAKVQEFKDTDIDAKFREAASKRTDGDLVGYVNRMLIEKVFEPWLRRLPVRMKIDDNGLRESEQNREWVRLRRREDQSSRDVVWERANRITGSEIERWLGGSLMTSSIAETEMMARSTGEQRDLVLAASGDVVAIVREGGAFNRLINRKEVLDHYGKQSAHA